MEPIDGSLSREVTARNVDAVLGIVVPQRLPPSRQQLSAQELEELRPVIKELYIEKGLTFKEVQKILHVQYNWKPT